MLMLMFSRHMTGLAQEEDFERVHSKDGTHWWHERVSALQVSEQRSLFLSFPFHLSLMFHPLVSLPIPHNPLLWLPTRIHRAERAPNRTKSVLLFPGPCKVFSRS